MYDRRTLRPRWRTPVSRSTDDVGHGRSVARPYCCPYPRGGDPHQISLSSATERQRNGRGSQQGLDDGRIVVTAPVRLSRGQTIVQRFFRCRLESSRPSVLLSQASNGRRSSHVQLHDRDKRLNVAWSYGGCTSGFISICACESSRRAASRPLCLPSICRRRQTSSYSSLRLKKRGSAIQKCTIK